MLLAEGVEIETALSEFRGFVGDLPMVAFNAQFDMAFLHSELDLACLPQLTNRVSCALQMARKAWPGRSSYRLTNLCRDAGISIVSQHRALPDCERALRVYVAAAQSLGRS